MGFIQPVTEMIPETKEKMFLGSKVQPMRRADSCEPIV
jgi:hypothetical protein